jgi:hypothetical protein
MAKFSDLPVELIVPIMINLAMPSKDSPAYFSWKERSGSFRDAYSLAITNKKHYSAFKRQKRQIFLGVAKGILLGADGCYDITLQFGKTWIYANKPEPKEMPTQVCLSVQTFVPLQPGNSADGEARYYAAVLRWLREHDIHNMLSAPRSTPGWEEPEATFNQFVRDGGTGWDMYVTAVYPLILPYYLEIISRMNVKDSREQRLQLANLWNCGQGGSQVRDGMGEVR